MRSLLRDAFRQLRRSPLFTFTAVLSLAIGIGANTAIFTIANGLLLTPTAGVTDMSRLVDIGRTTDGSGFDTVSYMTYLDLRDRVDAFSGVYATRLEPEAISLGGNEGAERIYGEIVSASYFDVLGVKPAAGRVFHSAEEQLGAPLRIVVLSHVFWTSRFAADPGAVGRTIVLNGDPFVIAGVAPAGFHGATILVPDLWVPLTSHARAMPDEAMLRGRQNNSLVMGARLKPGVTLTQAQAQANAFMREMALAYPNIYSRYGLALSRASRVPGLSGQLVPFLALLMSLVGLVLLVACINLAGLMLSRAATRAREVAVRLALGASRRQIAGLLLTETLVLFAIGAVAAIGVARLVSNGLLALLPSLPVQIAIDLPLDWRALVFTAGITLVTGLLTGAAPAWQSARVGPVMDLKGAATSKRRQRLRHFFIAAQMAFCLVLIVVAGLLLRALSTATHVDAGFAIDNIEIASVDFALGGYEDARAVEAAESVRERIAASPGIAATGIAAMVALDGGGLGLGSLRRPGATDPAQFISTDWNVISPEYFDAIRLPIVTGRAFSHADRPNAPLAAIVNEHFARTVWPDRDAVGQVLENGDFRPGRESTIRRFTIVGIARDAKYRWLGELPRPFIYVPLAQQPMRSLHYFVRRDDRAAPDASAHVAVRQALTAFDRNLPLVRFMPFREYAALGLIPQRLAASLAGSLGALALLLAAIGIYGVTAFAVASRTREIGVRMALGADRFRVMRWVISRGLKLTLAGGLAGLAVALAATRALSGLLFGVSPFDPLAFGGTAAALTLVTIAASWVPARRAARTDPIVALRAE